MNSDPNIKHSKDCHQQHWKACAANKIMASEKANEHWWSGWPGAFCMKCGIEDYNELCLADDCKCQCHNEFWKGYEQYCKEYEHG